MQYINDLQDDYPDFYELWHSSILDVDCDEFMRLNGFNSAKFITTSKTHREEIGFWEMSDDDYKLFLLLWGA